MLDLEDIEKGTGRVLRMISASQRPVSGPKTNFRAGDVLYGSLRPYLNKVIVADRDGYCTSQIIVVTPERDVDPEFLSLWLQSPWFVSWAVSNSRGSTMPRLGIRQFAAAPIAIPATSEQRAAVDSFRNLSRASAHVAANFDRRRSLANETAVCISSQITSMHGQALDSGLSRRLFDLATSIDATDEAFDALGSLVLRLGVSGRLAACGAEHDQVQGLLKKLVELEAPLPNAEARFEGAVANDSSRNLPCIPAHWKWARLEDVADFSGGFAFQSSRYVDARLGIPIVRISDLGAGLDLRNPEVAYSHDDAADLVARFRVPYGALLVSMSGTIGRVAFNLREDLVLLNQRVGQVVPRSVHPLFLAYVICSEVDRLRSASVGSAIPNLATAQVKGLPVPIPPYEEQRLIAHRISYGRGLVERLRFVRAAERRVATSVARSLLRTMVGTHSDTAV